jgi:hypothetical protein
MQCWYSLCGNLNGQIVNSDLWVKLMCAVEILLSRNLAVRKVVIYCTQVARDTFMVSPR